MTRIEIDEYLCTGCGACHQALPFLAEVMPGDAFPLTDQQTVMHRHRLETAQISCKTGALIITEE